MWLTFTPTKKEVFRNDPMGHGHFGAPRGDRKHNGVDLVAQPGTTIFCPFDAKITKLGTVYTATPLFKYVELQGIGLLSLFKMRIMYVQQNYEFAPVKVGDVIPKSRNIGQVQNIAAYHGGGMINHIHVELRLMGKLIDPTPFIKTS